jgi:fructose-1,6-bisphosphatase/inositol monophosphatase family enzyme
MTRVAFDPIECAVPIPFSDRVAETAISAARRAGAIQLNHFRNATVRCTRLLHDVKLETDQVCEKAIIATIRETFPDHLIFTEESGGVPGSGEYTWIVDPLDGTVNFWHGLPFFCVSIACYRNGGRTAVDGGTQVGLPGAPVTGVVFLPFSQELFVGTPGRGAFLNGRPIRVTNTERISDAVVTISFGKTPEMMRRMTQRLDVLLPQVRKARCLGAVAAELAYIAAGFLGGLVYDGIKLWDFAAGKILLEEAGGCLEAEETDPGLWRVLAGTPIIRESLKSVLDRRGGPPISTA